jgi:hypothetical protein
VAEGARLESVYTGNRIEGSNPSPSASFPQDRVLFSPKPVRNALNWRGQGDRPLYVTVGTPRLSCSLRPIFLQSSVLRSESTDFRCQHFQSVYKPSRSTSLNRSPLTISRFESCHAPVASRGLFPIEGAASLCGMVTRCEMLLTKAKLKPTGIKAAYLKPFKT